VGLLVLRSFTISWIREEDDWGFEEDERGGDWGEGVDVVVDVVEFFLIIFINFMYLLFTICPIIVNWSSCIYC